MSKLATAIKQQQNKTLTEKGALTFKTSESALLDFFSQVGGRRGQNITQYFSQAFAENEVLATVAGFWLRDARGGTGERELFRQVLAWLADNKKETFLKVFKLVPEYGRWDDLFPLSKHEDVGPQVTRFIIDQLQVDLVSPKPSLLAKWMPSINTSSKDSVRLAAYFAHEMGVSFKVYRKSLSNLRAKLRIVERDMSANEWTGIKYSAVPSYAGKLYRKAFFKHDKERYEQFLADVKTGKTKINASVLYPYDLVREYVKGLHSGYGGTKKVDPTIEAQWAALPNYADTEENALVIADLSGSMFNTSNPSPAEVAVSLAIYVAERNKGLFRDHWMNFSGTPQFYTLKGKTLFEKIRNLDTNNWAGTTNLQSAFNLILSAAVQNKVPQEEMPTKLFIVSDMQFDSVTGQNGRKITNFEAIQKKYEDAGYTLPTVVFWNVAARASQSPVTKDESGVYLVSGASPSIFRSAVNTKAVTPHDLMLEVLNSQRYSAVREVLGV